MHSKTIIEIQYFKNCPNAPILISRVQEAIKDLDQIGYQEVLIETNEMAEENKFRGSPTLLIDGEDFEGTPEPEESFLSCVSS